MKIAILARGFDWGGGMDFLRNIANAILYAKRSDNSEIYLFLPADNKSNSFESLIKIAYRSVIGSIQRRKPYLAVQKKYINHKFLDYFENIHEGRIKYVIFDSSDSGLLKALNKIKADIVLPVNGFLSKSFPIPWVGYAYDFQHRYLYQNFTVEECYQRDIDYANRLKEPKCIIVNSQAVKCDIGKFYPWQDLDKIFNLPFSPNAPVTWFESLDFDIYQLYNIPKKFFLVSNQFWIHKDHPTTFRAFMEIATNNDDVALVLTGEMKDYRRPGYIDELRGLVDRHNLQKRVFFLGHIPKRHQIEIMKDALAVVQSTLFEGGPGGGCAYDAVSLGVPIILSDIPVNMEIDAPNVYYFSCGDHSHLSRKMQDVIDAPPDRPSTAELINAGRIRLEALGSRLFEAIEFAIEHKKYP